jgi:Tol biopolymer transport system component
VIFEAKGWLSHPRISPDGRRIGFINHLQPADTAGEAVVVDASGGTPEVWSPPFDELLGLAWEPDGKSLLITGSLKGSVDFLWRARRGRAPELVYAAPGNLLLADVSRNGRALVMQTDWRQEIEIIGPDGTQRSLEWLDWGLLGDLSLDGTKVLMSEDGKGAVGNTQLLLRDVSQPSPVKLGSGLCIALSPDGQWAVTVDRGESQGLTLVPTGPGEPRRLPPSGLARIDRGTFFPDGKRLALIGAKTATSPTTVFVYDLKTGESRPVTSEGAGDMVAVSRDGQRLAASSTGGIITIFPLDGGEPIRVESWDSSWRVVGWLEDGSLVALQPYVIPSRLERFDPRTRKVSPFKTIAPLDPAGVPGLIRARLTPDGRTIAFQLRRMSSALTVLDWGGPLP